MNRRLTRTILRAVSAIPGLYAVLAFITGRRAAVSGWSMHPALSPGERVIFDRLAYARSRPRAGDIVLARHPARPGITFVKRIAAVPSDPLPFGVSGEPIPNIANETAPMPQPSGWGGINAPGSANPRSLLPGEYLLLGDNPDFSTDSRDLGPFRRRDILARAWIVYWPAERARVLERERQPL